MNFYQKQLIIASSIIGATTIAYAALYKFHQKQVVKRFSHIDPKVARKAYNQLTRNIVAGKYADLSAAEVIFTRFDELFMQEVNNLTK